MDWCIKEHIDWHLDLALKELLKYDFSSSTRAAIEDAKYLLDLNYGIMNIKERKPNKNSRKNNHKGH